MKFLNFKYEYDANRKHVKIHQSKLSEELFYLECKTAMQ